MNFKGEPVNHGAFSMCRDAGDSDGISAVAQDCAGDYQPEPLRAAIARAGSGHDAAEGKFPLRVIEVDGVRGVCAFAGLRGKIDGKRNSVLVVGGYGRPERHAYPRATEPRE